MTHISLIDTEFGELLSRLPSGLDLDVSARMSGALVRRRGVKDAAGLLRLALGYAACGLSLRGAAAWAEVSAVARLSDVALLNRLRRPTDWLGEIVAAILSERLAETAGAGADRRVRLVDATTLSCSGSRKTDWRVHVGFRLGPRPRIEQLELSDGRGAESLDRFVCGPGDIVIGDAGYAKAQDLARLDATGAAFIVRTGWNAVRLRTPNGAPLDLFAVLASVPERGVAEVTAAIALDRAGTQRLPIRLVILGKSAEEAARARRKSRKQGKTPKKETLQAAGFIVLLSSLDEIDFPAADVLEFYRLRWQIELVSKRLKSLLHLDQLPAKDPDLARCWIYAKIIVALLLEDMSGPVLDSPPRTAHTRARRPASPWRIQRMLFDFIIVAAIIGPTTYRAWRAGATLINYRLADPPRRRTSQFDTARQNLC